MPPEKIEQWIIIPRLETERIRASLSRAAVTWEKRDALFNNLRVCAFTLRGVQTLQQHGGQITNPRAKASTFRAATIPEEQDIQHIHNSRLIQSILRLDPNKAALKYNEDYEYNMPTNIVIDIMAHFEVSVRNVWYVVFQWKGHIVILSHQALATFRMSGKLPG